MAFFLFKGVAGPSGFDGIPGVPGIPGKPGPEGQSSLPGVRVLTLFNLVWVEGLHTYIKGAKFRCNCRQISETESSISSN